MKKKILFVTYGGGHVRIVIPIIEELISRKHEVSILGLTSSVKDLKKYKYDYKNIRDYLSLFDYIEQKKILEYGELVIDDAFDDKSGLDKDDIKVYLGINLWDLSLQYENFDKCLNEFKLNGRRGFFPINLMERIIRYENPDVLVVTSGQRSEKAAAIVANKMDIQVVRIIDLLGENLVIPYDAKVCVMNDYAKNNILESNSKINTNDVFVTGQPNIELKYNYRDQIKFYQNNNLDKYEKKVSFFSQPNIPYRSIVFKEYIKLFESNSNYFGVWKLHPNEDISLYDNLVNQLPPNLIVVKDDDTNVLIEESNLVITFYSTVGLQAIVAGKLLLVINLTKKDFPIDYAKLGCAKLVRNVSDFQNTINYLLKNNINNDEFYDARNKLKAPNNAAKNISNVIENI